MEKVATWKMFFCVQWLIAMLLKMHTTGSDFVTHGKIFPTMQFAQKGSNISLFCMVNNSSLTSSVFWRLTPDLTPAPQYEMVNETVSSITIRNLLAASVTVTCLMYKPKIHQVLDEIKIETGYPPETPHNVSCIYYHKQNFTCTWISAKANFIMTIQMRDGQKILCRSAKNSCSYFYGREQFGCEYEVQVEAENAFGKTASHVILMNTSELVKMDPPHVLSLKSLPAGEGPSFLLSWRRPTLAPEGLDVKCSLQYKELQSGEWSYHHNLNMEKAEKMSYNLTGLSVYTEYAISLRCIGNNGQIIWSEWSEEITGRTAEKAPSHSVELWRVISSSDNIRSVHLKWKERSNLKSPGILLGYTVQWFPEDRTFATRNKTTNQNELILTISDEAYIISVAYYNSAGWSPNATLRIPASNEKAQSLIENVQISTRDENATVTWTVTDLRIQRFVVEWCVDLETKLCIISFQYVENASEWTGIFEPYNRYRISVYPILAERVEAPYITYFYIKEGAPLRGPEARIENPRKTEATIKWAPIRQDETNGFLTTFSIIYKSLDGHASVVTVDSHVCEYTLQSLLPNTLYSAYVVASTRAGNTSGNHLQFSTLKYNSKDIGKLIGTIGICVMLLTVVGITYAHKKEKIRNFFWINVPDPAQSSLAEWPSDGSQTALFLDPVQSDGEFYSGDLQILYAVYKNERVPLMDEKERRLLFADIPKRTEPWMSLEEASPVHYATTESCHDCLAFTPPLNSTSCSASSVSSLTSSLGDAEMPHSLELAEFIRGEMAAVNPYLRNSVKTREAIHVADN